METGNIVGETVDFGITFQDTEEEGIRTAFGEVMSVQDFGVQEMKEIKNEFTGSRERAVAQVHAPAEEVNLTTG